MQIVNFCQNKINVIHERLPLINPNSAHHSFCISRLRLSNGLHSDISFATMISSRSGDVTSLSGRRTKQLAAYKKGIRQTPQADVAICYVANPRKQLTPLRESPFAFCLHCPRNSRRGKSRIVWMADSWCPRILSTELSANMSEFFHDSPTFEWLL